MKVLVTGGCGFLGSHVCEFYVKKGAQVVAYDNMTKHELQRTGLATAEARDFNWNFLQGLGVRLIKADVSVPDDGSQDKTADILRCIKVQCDQERHLHKLHINTHARLRISPGGFKTG